MPTALPPPPMEPRLLSDLRRSSEQNPDALPSMATILSLIANPHTSESTLDFVLQTLITHLQNPNSLPLLAVLGRHSSTIRRRVASSLHHRLAEVPEKFLPLFLTLLDALGDESLFFTIGFSSSERNRRWLLRNVNLFDVKPSVLVTVLLGFSRDPFPYVRESVLDCFVSALRNNVVVEDLDMAESCYFRCVEMLFDVEKCVRCSAVRAVSVWGQLLLKLSNDSTRRERSDALFVQLCLMVRDMDMEVRVAAFDSLEKFQTVSEDVLLQTLSKKAVPSLKEKDYPGKYTIKHDRIPATASAFAFGHGLEDEYHEVRRSACCALQKLSVLAAEFSVGALHMLMGMLNDDTVGVRLLALETLSRLAMQDYLKLEESHLDMFVSTLFESDALIRCATRKVIMSTKFPKLVLFRKCIDSLVKNYETYPEDELDVFSALYKIGHGHGRYTMHFVQEIARELEPSFDGQMSLHKRRMTALFVLAISSPVHMERRICSVEPQIFSYATTILGQLSHALGEITDQNALLAYLARCSRFTYAPPSIFFNEEAIDRLHPEVIDKQSEENVFPELINLKKFIGQCNNDGQLHNCSVTILHGVVDLWALIQLGCFKEVVPTLRSWKEELRSFARRSAQNAGPSFFISTYLHVIKLLGKVWSFIFLRNSHSPGVEIIEALLGKTEKKLKEMMHRFTGLSREVKAHVLEIALFAYSLRLAYGGIHCFDEYAKRVKITLGVVEEGFVEPSDFIAALQSASVELEKSEGESAERIELFRKPISVFSLRRLDFSGEIKYVSAYLNVCGGNDYQNTLPFVPGLPVGVPLELTLGNVYSECRLWLMMSLGEESTEFLFVDSPASGKREFVATFSSTPFSKNFSIRVSIVMECFDVCYGDVKGCCGGPKYECVHLCKEKDVHLFNYSG